MYPGRRATEYDASVDHNCNGIFGGNETAASFEELFCADSQARGLVMLGDSATAHFHIPPQWLTANGWNLNQLLPDAEDELDGKHLANSVDSQDSPLAYRLVPSSPFLAYSFSTVITDHFNSLFKFCLSTCLSVY